MKTEKRGGPNRGQGRKKMDPGMTRKKISVYVSQYTYKTITAQPESNGAYIDRAIKIIKEQESQLTTDENNKKKSDMIGIWPQ